MASMILEDLRERAQRRDVIAEARTWIGTPFLHEARIKGAGVDCGQYLIAVYSKVGAMPDFKPAHYSSQRCLHRNGEEYMADMLRFTREVDAPEIGDIAMFHFGRSYAHAGIIVHWPILMIHAFHVGGVQLTNPSIDGMLLRGWQKHPPRFFSPWGRP